MGGYAYTWFKGKKRSMAYALDYLSYNHPNRLSEYKTSGLLSLTIDERLFTHIGTYLGAPAKVYEFSLDFSEMTGYTRKFETIQPWKTGSPPSGGPGAGQFLLSHVPRVMWKVGFDYGGSSDVTIGTCLQSNYESDGDGGHDFIDSEETYIAGSFYVLLGSPHKGGDPVSGGRDDGSDDEKIGVIFRSSFSGPNWRELPDFGTDSGAILRLPWDDAWGSESAVFSTIFDDFIAYKNTEDGGGYSGSCSLSLETWQLIPLP